MAQGDEADIKRILAACFRGNDTLSSEDIIRILTFELGWMDDEKAEVLIASFIKNGWVVGDVESLTPTFSTKNISAPLGWFPRIEKLLHLSPPPVLPVQQTQNTALAINKLSEEAPVTTDARQRKERRLIRYISDQSGLGKTEVLRRAKRKETSFVVCTTWMALALVAREQNLDMDDIIESLSSSRVA
ncbi:MAG: DUF2240 family protein [Candidatus Thermoplasmatota archaeon]|nr:DUF2240 family protein [Candidatus Thermoplasmatota archaeon]